MSNIKQLLLRPFLPKSHNPDTYRKELILNSLLFLFLFLLSSLLLLTIYCEIKGESNLGLGNLFLLLLPFILSYYLSRKQKILLASIVLISIFTLGTWIAIISWDILLPSAMLSLVLCTVIVGHMVNSRSGFIYAIISGVALLIFSYLSSRGIVTPDRSWQTFDFKTTDTIEIIVFLLFTSGIAWISNRQTEDSLRRAVKSERELKIERDNLEIKVIERTKQIEEIQIEKISELYTFIEFGKISAGLIHDIMSPLTALCIDIETNQINNTGTYTNSETKKETKVAVNQLLNSSKKIQEIVKAAKNQIKINLEQKTFNITDSIHEILLVNQHRIKQIGIYIKLKANSSTKLTGYQSLFVHILTNLLSNAIDACKDKREKTNSKSYKPAIEIIVTSETNTLNIKIKDNGVGVPEEIRDQIFNPFFSTKGSAGCGFGLAASKHIAEKYFNATLSVKVRNPRETKIIHKQMRTRDLNEFRTDFILTIPLSTVLK